MTKGQFKEATQNMADDCEIVIYFVTDRVSPSGTIESVEYDEGEINVIAIPK